MESEQEKSKSGKREVEREGRRVEIKRRCWKRVSRDSFEDFSSVIVREDDGLSLGVSVCACCFFVCDCCACCACCACFSWDVNVIGETVLSVSECEVVKPQTLSLSTKREAFFVESREDMNADGTPEKTPPAPRKKVRGIEYGGEHRWSTLDKVVMARVEHYLDRRESPGVDIEELEYSLLGPNELDVDITHIAMNAKGEKHQRLFHTFSQQGVSEFMVASVARWDEHSIILVIHERKCRELSQPVQHMSDKARMERTKILQSEVPEEFHKQIFQETTKLEERLSG